MGNALPTTDLFSRTVGGDNSAINSLLDKLVSMDLNLAVNNNTGFAGSATLTDGTPNFSKTLNLTTGTSTMNLSLNPADIQYIRGKIPFVLKLNVGVPDSTYYLKRGGGISAGITVSTVTDVDQTFNLRGVN